MSVLGSSFWEAAEPALSLDADLVAVAREAWQESWREREEYEERAALNQVRVAVALSRSGLDESGLAGSWGYGYGDRGRESLERAWSEAFSTEAALVRPQIATGTQALALCLQALLRPGDEVLTWPGAPYDTMQGVLGNLVEWGIGARAVSVEPEGDAGQWVDALAASLEPRTRVVLVQRSRGYSLRRALRVGEIGQAVEVVRTGSRRAVVLVDNCYGEFVEEAEPGAVGADLCAGSLIKNPGGGLAPTGGYIAGRADLVAQVAARLYAPGQGGEVGPTGSWLRMAAQGLFLAPHAVGQALGTAVFAAHFFARLGMQVVPAPGEERGDIVQSVVLGTPARLRSFCRGLQQAGPVDARARPEPWEMPGYRDRVIMAGGTFVPGASLELGADAPLRPPYAAYLQGGTVTAHGVLGCLLAAARLRKDHPDGSDRPERSRRQPPEGTA
ncbi:MAG: methionine gamma-lyase family protein [Bacillota bacterium]|nr:methionine gamma-lyase family protein [Bacillota bacterium]